MHISCDTRRYGSLPLTVPRRVMEPPFSSAIRQFVWIKRASEVRLLGSYFSSQGTGIIRNLSISFVIHPFVSSELS